MSFPRCVFDFYVLGVDCDGNREDGPPHPPFIFLAGFNVFDFEV